MKKTLLVLLFISFFNQAFSQTNEAKKTKITTLIEMNDNSKYFTELVSINIDKIKKDKQASFRNEIAMLAAKKKAEAIRFFMKKYSTKEINAIYADYSVPNSLAYSQKTLSFLREWKTYKLLFQKEFKAVFSRY